MPRALHDHTLRLIIIVILLGVLFSLFVLFGTVSYDPAMNNFPGNDEIGPDPEAYTGKEVEAGGTVVATDPIIIEIEYGIDQSKEITLMNVDTSVSEGQRVSAFGTLTTDGTLDTERVLTSYPWEIWYMYAVSIIAALWVAARIVTQWKFDRDQLAFVPRGDTDG